jgi:hypothetical protein
VGTLCRPSGSPHWRGADPSRLQPRRIFHPCEVGDHWIWFSLSFFLVVWSICVNFSFLYPGGSSRAFANVLEISASSWMILIILGVLGWAVYYAVCCPSVLKLGAQSAVRLTLSAGREEGSREESGAISETLGGTTSSGFTMA